MRKKFDELMLLLVVALCCLPGLPLFVSAQSALPWVFHAGATNTDNGNAMPADYFSTVAVQIEGPFVGTVVFEKKTRDASVYALVQCVTSRDRSIKATESNEPGYWECPGGASSFRVRISSYTSGTIIVTGTGTTAVSSSGGGDGGVTGWPNILSSAAATSEAASDAVSIRGKGAQATNGADLFQSSSGFFEWVCVVANVRNACNYIRQLGSGFYTEIRNNSGSPIFTVTNNTGALTNVKIDCEETGNLCTLYQPICGGDLAGVDPTSGTAGHIWDKSPLDTAPTATTVTGTNQTYGVIRFPDVDGDYGVQVTCVLPPGFTGNLDAVAWGKTTGTGNFRLQIATKCYASDEANDAAFNMASVFTLAAGTSGRLNRYALSNITQTGCAANEIMIVRAFRNRTEGSDTLNSTFDLKNMKLWARSTY